jgi:hypothetical protein
VASDQSWTWDADRHVRLHARHEEGVDVTGLDPAGAMLDVARAKRVRWTQGAAVDLPPLQVHLVTMTGNGQSFQRLEIPDVGVVETWNDVINAALPLVTFRGIPDPRGGPSHRE